MLAECYSEELGIEKDEYLSSEWIDKAIELNCAGAMHRKAKNILRTQEHSNSDSINQILSFIESNDENENDNFNDYETSRSEIDQNQNNQISSPQSTRSRGKSSSPNRKKSENNNSSNNNFSVNKNSQNYLSTNKLSRNNLNLSLNLETSCDDLKYKEDENNSDLELAIQLLLRAAERGFVAAKTDLGILFELAFDYENAVKW